MPPGPVVVYIVTPVFKAGGDALPTADGVQLPGGFQQGLFPCTLTDDNQALLVPVHVHVEVILGHVGKIEDRAVVVNQVVTVVAEELFVVVEAGDGEAAVEQVGTPVVQICSVHSAHGSTEGHDALVIAVGKTCDMLDGGNQLGGDVAHPLLVVLDAPAVVSALSGPCFVVDGVAGEYHHLAGLDPGSPGLVHMEALEVPEAACLAGDEQNGLAAVAIDLEFHLAVQVSAPMLFVPNFHEFTSLLMILDIVLFFMPCFYIVFY